MVAGAVTVEEMASWDSLEKRIAWIQQNRGMSMSALSEAAGLARATVGNTVRRERDGGPVGFSGDTLVKLAKAARVSLNWLSSGEGDPEPGYVEESTATTADTQSLINKAARMLIELDGLSLPNALVALHDVQLPSPSVDGYYRAARLRLRDIRDVVTPEFEELIVNQVRRGAAQRVAGANKKRD